MRERIARAFAVVLGVLVVGLAAAFAARRNAEPAPPMRVPAEATEAPPSPTVMDPEAVTRGRAGFEAHGCSRCHRLEGVGNPRSPLDGVGARLTPERIRAFIVADPSVAGGLGPSVVRAKRAYADLPAPELDALVAYLASSRP